MQDNAALRGKLEHSASLARYTSWRVGGAADVLYTPLGLADLCVFLQQLPLEMPVHFIGLGSNLLVRDGGVRGAVVVMHNVLTTLEMQDDILFAAAGVTCAKVAKFSAKNAKTGAEFLAGIPGTVGGALAMNAGCYGSETWDVVKKVATIDRAGHTHVRDKTDFITSYRHVDYKVESEWFIGAWFELKNGDAVDSAEKIKGLLAKRLASQPLNLPNAGSTFRNPIGDYAARLIEAAGLKGVQIGGAQISEKHANFIVNVGGASASDIQALIDLMRNAVLEKFDVALQQEVRVIGETMQQNRKD